jgi:CheY-like chemotaxis protein
VQPKKILVVDDEDHIREIASVSLELTRHWQISTAASGAEAIRAAQEMRPDAILLDVMMPEMDGPTTLGRLQEDPSTRDIPVIFLTAKVQAADRRRFKELGVRSMIAKPFDPLRLATDVAAALEWNGGDE